MSKSENHLNNARKTKAQHCHHNKSQMQLLHHERRQSSSWCSHKKQCHNSFRPDDSHHKFTVNLKLNSITIMQLPKRMLLLHLFLLVLLLLQCPQNCWCARRIIDSGGGGLDIYSEGGTKNITTHDNAEHCVIVVEETEIKKEIGSVWVSSANPCAIHACEADSNGQAREIITEEDCGQFYCNVASELRSVEGSCCGECVRTKCFHDDKVYEVGQTWKKPDDCTILECTRLPTGEPVISAYQKSCPPLPRDCAPRNTFTVDCCQYCNHTQDTIARLNGHPEIDDVWTEEYYRNHPCVRNCHPNEPPMTCQYKFVVEWYHTLSKACFNCPSNMTDCQRPHCIIGDGVPRSVTVVNRMMPGPLIDVCEGDTIIVDVENNLLGESTTMHWHGMHQKQSPYMDGVPHITQCPISPHSSFRYTFVANNPGTHFWHSHTGMQRGDGVFGALIVRRVRTNDPHGDLYDFDLSEHIMIVQDWVHIPGISMFADHHHSRGDNKPRNLLINGHGRYYEAIWEKAKAEAANITAANRKQEILRAQNELRTEDLLTIKTTPSPTIKPRLNSIDPVRKLEDKKINEISRQARLAANMDVPTLSTNNSTTPIFHRSRRAAGDYNIELSEIPLQIYHVRQGHRYRFRIINAEFLNCPIAISIDNHTLLAINSDGYDFEVVEVGSIVTYAGERFDFVLNANQPIGNYWVRLKGLMDCSEQFTSAFQVAILRYEQAPEVEPTGELGYHYNTTGIELNVMNRGPGHVDSLTIAELNALPAYDTQPGIDRDTLKPVADYKFFVYYDFYVKNNPEFHPGDLYGIDANLSASNRLFTPQLNHISLKFPAVALLPARAEVDESYFCNETSLQAQGIDCRKEFCKCHHILQVPLNSIVEFIIVDEGFTFDANHPFHLHGNAFRVVGLERLGTNVTIEMVKQLDRYNKLKRNLIRPPIKDTVTVPDGGYTILRFKAYNPGFWLFHCHIEFHAEIGMALVLKVGNNDEMLPVPRNFPTCHDYLPDMQAETTTQANDKNNGTNITANNWKTIILSMSMVTLLMSTILKNFKCL